MSKRAAACVCVLLALALSSSVSAQTVRTGAITGTVTDESRAALPGVAVSVTGPALQVPQLTTVSNARGEYEIKDLPPGTYQVTFELAGFAKMVRPDVQLTTGFVARIDQSMKIATVEETITVSGQSPLVDVETTRGGGTVSKDLLTQIPNNRNYQDIQNLTPGMVSTVPPQNGVIGMKGEANGFKNYGMNGNVQTTIEGVDMHSNENPDFAAVEEVDVKTFGNTAEIAMPGAAIQLIVKSGGNIFHGRYNEQYMTDKLQSDNVDAKLKAQNIAYSDAAIYYQDFSADLGGRIVRDKLWFYTAFRDKRAKRTLPGFAAAPGPDGVYASADDVPGFPVVYESDQMIKMSYQPSTKHRFVGFYSRNYWDEFNFFGGSSTNARFTPQEATPYLRYYNYQSKGEWNGTLGNRLLANVFFGDGWYVADYSNECDQANRAPCTPGKPAMTDLASGIVLGTPYQQGLFHRPRDRYQLNATVSYFPESFLGGSHEFKVGFSQWWERLELSIPDRGAAGNYQLQFDNGLPGQLGAPSRFVTTNFPVDGKSATNSNAAFLTDTWRVTKRITVNLGARIEHAHAFVPPQTKVQGVFGGSGSFAEIDGGTWNTWAPRAGFAFDLSGDGKTVMKATYGWFNELLSDGFANAYNPNTQTTTTYRWNDPNGDRLYQPGEVDLRTTAASLDYLSISGGSTTFKYDGFKKPYAQEVTSSIERELPSSMSARLLWVYQSEDRSQSTVNVLRPYSAYSIPIVRKDPGPDGVYNTADDGGNITLYDYSAEYRGSAFTRNEFRNADPKLGDHFNSFEVTIVKRPSASRWFATTAFLFTKNHAPLTNYITNPNQELFNLNTTAAWSYRLAGAYRAPAGVNISSLFTLLSGQRGQRTYSFRQTDPNGGAPISNAGNTTIRLEPYGASKGPVKPNLNLKVGKSFSLGGSKKISGDFDLLNVLNSNPSYNTVFTSGPTFGQITAVQPPRIARFNFAFEF